MQKKCHGCGVISDVENKPFAACPECGLPYGAKPVPAAADLPPPPVTSLQKVAQALRRIDPRPELPEPPRWFSPGFLATMFWLYAALLLVPAFIAFFKAGINAITIGGLILSVALVIAARVTLEVVLAIFHAADNTHDTARSLRILIREEARRQTQEPT